jgi:hypothetical protein
MQKPVRANRQGFKYIVFGAMQVHPHRSMAEVGVEGRVSLLRASRACCRYKAYTM